MPTTMEKLVNHCKSNGFMYQGSEIYGGLANAWDYGPLGIELKNNIMRMWWKKFIQENPHNVGLDSAILMNPNIWVASGHVGGFNDPLMDCKSCKTRHRADHLIEDFDHSLNVAGWSNEKMEQFIKDNNIACPNCGGHDFTEIKQFELMFKTKQGVTDDNSNTLYLRPETAQGIFVNFKNVQRSTRKKLPLGIGQVGKSFRNEITPGNFIFRTREFEQMELEFFVKPGTDSEWYNYWKQFCWNWLISLGINENSIKFRDHEADELSHYSKATCDIEYQFPFGMSELWGIANRTDFDLRSHQNASKQNLEYHDPETNEKYLPYCIEPALGLGRVLLAFLNESYDEEVINEKDTRVVMHLHPALAPVKACILPLQKQQVDQSLEVYAQLAKYFNIEFDQAGNIGKRYRRQDAIGTPLCITIDFDTQETQTVTVRHRDSMEQERVAIADLKSYIEKVIEF